MAKLSSTTASFEVYFSKSKAGLMQTGLILALTTKNMTKQKKIGAQN